MMLVIINSLMFTVDTSSKVLTAESLLKYDEDQRFLYTCGIMYSLADKVVENQLMERRSTLKRKSYDDYSDIRDKYFKFDEMALFMNFNAMLKTDSRLAERTVSIIKYTIIFNFKTINFFELIFLFL